MGRVTILARCKRGPPIWLRKLAAFQAAAYREISFRKWATSVWANKDQTDLWEMHVYYLRDQARRNEEAETERTKFYEDCGKMVEGLLLKIERLYSLVGAKPCLRAWYEAASRHHSKQ